MLLPSLHSYNRALRMLAGRFLIPFGATSGSAKTFPFPLVLFVTYLVTSFASSVRRTTIHDDIQFGELNLAFVGNSMLYYNDCPRLLEQMFLASNLFPGGVHQDSCLRGGGRLRSLWRKGNGMAKKFSTQSALLPDYQQELSINPNEEPVYDIGAPTVQTLISNMTSGMSAGWNVIIMNDQTQSPARLETREATQVVLREKYLPLVVQQTSENRKVTVLFLQTPAYQLPNIRNSQDLGDFDTFTNLVAAGYETYRQVFSQDSELSAAVAPVGEAYRYLRQHNVTMWEMLYNEYDHVHHSPHGTWLQACVLFCSLTHQAPPQYQAKWWDKARYMQPSTQEPMPLPSGEEAETLRQIANKICGVVHQA